MREKKINTSIKAWLTCFFWAVTLVSGFIYAWWSRHLMNSDGVCYLDISDAYIQQQWPAIITPYWSHLYPLILAFLKTVLSTHVYWEFTIAHIANFFLLVFSLASFHFFILQVLKSINDKGSFREIFVFASGYSLFVWTTLEWIGLHFITPDLGVSAFLFLSMGLMLKLFREDNPRATAMLFGGALGLGFWMKTILFPTALIFLVFLCIKFLIQKNYLKLKIILTCTLIPFVLLSSILIFSISMKKGKISYGESGKLAYLVEVQNQTQHTYWDMLLYNSEMHSSAKNAPDLLYETPHVVYFREGAPGTYPFAYDYSYWLEGLEIKLRIKDVAVSIRRNIEELDKLFRQNHQYIGIVFLILLLCHFRTFFFEFIKNSKIWLIPFIVLWMYLCIRVEGRYVGSLVCLILIGVFSSFRFKDNRRSYILYSILLVALIVPLLSSVFSHSFSWARSFKQSQFHRYHYIAQELQNVWNIRPGDKVAFIGHSFEQNWARVARVQIIAEIPLSGRDIFLKSSKEEKKNVLKRLKETPAKLVVIDNFRHYPLSKDWVPILGTSYYVHSLK